METEEKLIALITMLKEKKALLLKLSDLTNAQKESISQGDVDKLTSVINEREEIIKQTLEADDSFKKAYDALKKELGVDSLEKSDALPRTLLAELKDTTKDVMDMISSIIEADNENRKNAEALKDKFAAEIRNVNNTKKATNAYMAKPAVFQSSYYIDRKK